MSSIHPSSSLAGEASEIGWNLIEATSDKNAALFHEALSDLRDLLNRVDEISTFLREQPGERTVHLAAGRPIRRALARRPPEEHSEILERLEPPARQLEALISRDFPAEGLPSPDIVSQLKAQVASLTGCLSKADI
jgi:hypothetical protein